MIQDELMQETLESSSSSSTSTSTSTSISLSMNKKEDKRYLKWIAFITHVKRNQMKMEELPVEFGEFVMGLSLYFIKLAMCANVCMRACVCAYACIYR